MMKVFFDLPEFINFIEDKYFAISHKDLYLTLLLFSIYLCVIFYFLKDMVHPGFSQTSKKERYATIVNEL